MLMGLVACQMSTVDTFANVAAMALAYDIVEPVLARKNVSGQTRLSIARFISMGVILCALFCAFISDRLGDVYYISSGVLSACIAVPALFVFCRKTTTSAVMASAMIGFVGTVGGYWFEYKVLQATDHNAPYYYTDILPQWMHNAYGYHYVALGVLVSLMTIVTVSLVTKSPSESQLASLKDVPIDDYSEFVSSATTNA
jgi:SSS family solute:Na+ symporter